MHFIKEAANPVLIIAMRERDMEANGKSHGIQRLRAKQQLPFFFSLLLTVESKYSIESKPKQLEFPAFSSPSHLLLEVPKVWQPEESDKETL